MKLEDVKGGSRVKVTSKRPGESAWTGTVTFKGHIGALRQVIPDDPKEGQFAYVAPENLEPLPLFNDSDSKFSTHPGDTWSLDEVDTSLDPWDEHELAAVAALAPGEEVFLPGRDVTVRRLS